MLRLGRERDVLRIVDDQYGAPTSAAALAAATRAVFDRVASGEIENWAGTYHATCGGSTSWAGFARAIFREMSDDGPRVDPIPTALYPTPARRPRHSGLSGEKLRATFGVALPPWEQAMRATLAALPEQLAPQSA